MVQLDLVTAIREDLAAAADSERAESLRAYLKSELPCHGIGNAAVRRLVAARVRGVALTVGEWEALIRALWDRASHREERFAALSVARAREFRAYAERPQSLALYDYLIRTGAWWDLVDETAHLVEEVLIAHPDETAGMVRRWAVDDDVWVRRVAITAQLHCGAQTDLALLSEAIAGSVDDPDFFARKAIGWALRQYARTDPDWVRGYLAAHPGLSPLSVREASKHL